MAVANRRPSISHGDHGLYTEGDPPQPISPELILSDDDGGTLVGATVRISRNFVPGEDVLGFVNQNGISGSFDAATGVLTLTGTASLADYQAALRSVTYLNTSEDPFPRPRAFAFQVDDGELDRHLSDEAKLSIRPRAVNDTPVLAVDPTLTYATTQVAEPIDPSLTLVDVDSNLRGATVRITGNYTPGEDLLAYAGGVLDIRANWDARTGTLTLTGQASPADYQAALRLVTYTNTSATPSTATRTITVQAQDSRGTDGSQWSNLGVINVVYAAAPGVDPSGSIVAYTEGGTAVVLDAALVLSDADDPTLAGATVTISSGFDAGDSLLFTDTGAISGSYNAATGVLTLTGIASVADYQAALRSVQFVATSDDPSAVKTVTWVVNDGSHDSSPAVTTINVTAVNDAPVLTVGSTLSYTEDDGATVIAPAATLADVDSHDMNGGSLTVALTANGTSADQLGVRHEGTGAGQIGVSGSTITYGGATIGSFSGGASGADLIINFSSAAATPAAVQALVRSITFANTSNNPSTLARTVGFTLTDGDGGTDTASASATVNVAAGNDRPVITMGGGTAAYTEGSGAVVLDSALTLGDADDTQLESATVTITGNFQAGDALVFIDTPQITGSYNAGTGVLTLTGTATLAQYQAALRSIGFQSTNPGPSASKTVSWSVNDGSDNSTITTSNVAVTAVNEAPQLAITATLNYAEDDAAAVIAPSATVTDADSADFNGGSLTVSFTANGTGDDQLAVRHQGTGAGQIGVSGSTVSYGGAAIGSLSGGTGGADLVIAFSSAAATPAAVQALLRNITYANSSDTPSTLARTVGFALTDGDGGTDTAAASATVNVTPVNDAPAVSASAGSGAYAEGGGPVAIDPGITLADPDNTTFAGATVQITGSYLPGSDVLAFTNTAGMGNIAAGAFDAATGTLTLTSAGATATAAEWEAALAAVTFDTSSTSPGSSRVVTFQVNDGQGANNLSNAATRGIAIAEVNFAPTVTVASGAAAFAEGGAAAAVGSGIVLGDADGSTLAGATVSISGGFVSGQDVLDVTLSGGISGSYDAATGVLTLSGSATLAQYQTVLGSVTYENTSGAPDTGTRTLAFQVNDGQSVNNLSAAATRDVTVSAANSAPAVGGLGALAYTEADAFTVIAPSATVSDVDSPDFAGGTLTVSFGATGTADDQLGLVLAAGWTESASQVFRSGEEIATMSGGTNGADLVFTFTAAATPALVQDLVRQVAYMNGSVNPSTTPRTVSFTVVDGDGGSDTGSANATIHVTAVNAAPALAGSAATPLAYTEDDGPTVLDNGIGITDIDSSTLSGATVTVSSNFASGEDVLSFTPVGSITGSFDAATGVLTLSGTDSLANYETALRSVQYENTSQNPGTAIRTIGFQVDDGGSADHASNVITRDVSVTPVNDAPTITAGGSLSYIEGAAATAVRSTLTITDAEGDAITGATVSITGNFDAAEDVLSFTPSGAITGSYDAASGVLTLSGSGTAAEYQAVLRSVSYSNASEAPSSLARTITFAATDSHGETSVATSTVNVTSVNDAPVNTVPANAAVGTAFSNTALAISGVSVADIDAGSGTMTVALTASNGGLTLSLAGGATVSAGTNGSGAVTLSGTAAQLNDALATLSYKSADGFTGSATITVTTSDGGNTGGGLQTDTDGFQVGVVPQVFVIDNTDTTADDASAGTAANAFNSIANFNTFAADGTGDYIYIKSGTGTYAEANGLTLLNNQQVHGNGQTLQFTNPVTGEVVVIGTGAAGSTPTISITGAGSAGITLAQGNTLKGFNVATTSSTQTAIRDGSGTVGTLTVSDVDVTGAGMAVDIDQGGTLNAVFDVLSGAGVQLAGSGIAGTFTGTTGTLSATSGAGFQVGDGGTANMGGTITASYGGTVTASGAARTVDIQDRAAGAGTISFTGAVDHTSPAGGAGIYIDDIAAGGITFSGTATLNAGTAAGISVSDVTGGGVTFSGNLDIDTTAGMGISLSSNTVATNFTGAQITVNTGTGAGISLTSNSGTVGFNNTGNGLDIVTTGGTGLVGTSSGVLTIQGTGNTISVTNGKAVDLSATTIGAAGLNFVSIGATGAVNGIVLANTGASGALTVTGTGVANSGGTLSGMSGDGIDINSGRINLAYMRILNPAGNGIDALNLVGSNSFSNGTITGFDAGGAHTENGIYWRSTGATAGTLTITNSTFSAGSTGNDGVLLESLGSGNMTLTVDNSTFTGLYGDGVQVYGTLGATATMRVTIQNSDFVNAVAGTGDGGISLDPYGDVNLIADINGNLLQDIIDHVSTDGAIGVTNGSTADADITIRNNTINSNLGGRGIAVYADGGTTDLLIDNNSVDNMGTNYSYGILVDFIGPATGNATLSNNDIGQDGPLWTSDGLGGAIWLNAEDGSTMTAALTNNVIDVNTSSTVEAVWLRSVGGSTLNATLTGNDIDDTAGTSVEVNALAGLSTTQSGTLNLNMSGNNLHAGGLTLTENQLGTLNVTQSSSAVLSSANGSPTVTATGSQATPTYGAATPPTPGLPSLPLWTTQAANPDGIGTLAAAQLAPLVEAAVDRWLATGLTETQKAALAGLVVGIADLNDGFVAAASGSLVLLDIDAAGHGWFVDSTPMDDAEFMVNGTSGSLLAISGEAAGRMDLLSALMHEIGHVLGLGDAYDSGSAGGVMHGHLDAGERHVPDTVAAAVLVGISEQA